MRAILRTALGFISLLILGACLPSLANPTTLFEPARDTLHPTLSKASLTPVLPQAPTASQTPMPAASDTPPAMEEHPVTITILYDNCPYDNRLTTAWGFSALVETAEHKILFDTGGDGRNLLNNIRVLDVDITDIEMVVLSHAHDDHTGGLESLLSQGIRPTVHLLPSFPHSFKSRIGSITTIHEVGSGQAFAEGIYTTGEMGGSIPEQALLLVTSRGLVVITGCAHPGIVHVVERAHELLGAPIHLVMGGFHLGSKNAAQLTQIIEGFRRLGVEQVAPSHCTGDAAIARFRQAYGEQFIQAGAGRVIVIKP